MRKKLTKHHILCKSRNWWNEPHNITLLRQNTHRALHCLFENSTIQEQFDTLLHINYTALTQSYREDILNIIDAPDWYVYERGILKPNKFETNER